MFRISFHMKTKEKENASDLGALGTYDKENASDLGAQGT